MRGESEASWVRSGEAVLVRHPIHAEERRITVLVLDMDMYLYRCSYRYPVRRAFETPLKIRIVSSTSTSER